MNPGKDVLAAVLGLRCSNVDRPSDWLWSFTFGSGDRMATLNIECPWRLVVDGSIVFGNRDHAQRFGHYAPLDGPRHCSRLLSGQTVNDVQVRSEVGDISLVFENDARLEVFNDSSGYEGWSFTVKGGKTLTALGGGKLTVQGRP
jgi:hypothetical protein